MSKFVTQKWIEVNDLQGGQYSANKNIKFKIPLLRSDLCNYSDVYVVAKGRTTVEAKSLNNRANKKVLFKNNAPFRSCI